MPLPDKAEVRAALRAHLSERLEAMARAARDTREGAVHEESRQEGLKDMRSTEQSYLARGQAMRAEALAEELARFDAFSPPDFDEDAPLGPGALVRVDVAGEARLLYLSAQGAGAALTVGGAAVTVVSPAAPMGRALRGKRLGDDFELRLRGALREVVVEEVA